MAGIFGLFDFTKPGKGVEPDEPQKRAPVRFFELLWRNLWKFIKLNLTYFIFLLPLILVFHAIIFDPIVSYTYILDDIPTVAGAPLTMLFYFYFGWPQWVQIALILLSAAVLGPLTCGLTYCLRNAVREEHYWYSDLWHRAKQNLGMGIVLGLVDVFMIGIGFFNISILLNPETELSTAMSVITLLAMLSMIFYLGMRNTLYTMTVSVYLTFGQLIRNALILTLAGLPRHLLTGVLQLLVLALVLLFNGVVELVALPLICLVLLGYISMFITYPLVDKYLIQPKLNESNGTDTLETRDMSST